MKLNDALSRIPWQDFEILVANRYRRHGWQVAHCANGPGLRAGSEVDLRMEKEGKLAPSPLTEPDDDDEDVEDDAE